MEAEIQDIDLIINDLHAIQCVAEHTLPDYLMLAIDQAVDKLEKLKKFYQRSNFWE